MTRKTVFKWLKYGWFFVLGLIVGYLMILVPFQTQQYVVTAEADCLTTKPVEVEFTFSGHGVARFLVVPPSKKEKEKE